MKRLHLNGTDTLILSDVIIPPKLARLFAPRVDSAPRPAARTVARQSAPTRVQVQATGEPYSLWKATLAETERPTPLLLRACYALFGVTVTGTIGYAAYSIVGLFHTNALDHAVQAFLK